MAINAIGREVQSSYDYKTPDTKSHPESNIPQRKETPKEPEDEYVPSGEKPDNGSGSYHLVEDGKGYKRIVAEQTDKKEQISPAASDSPSKPESKEAPSKPENRNSGGATVNTNQVENEIKRLNQERQRLEQQLNSARDDEDQRKAITQQLSQINAELASKDNDSYRKANAVVTLH